MKSVAFLFLFLTIINCSAQSKKDRAKSNSISVIRDSMLIISSAQIFDFVDENQKTTKAVKFQISVTNFSSKPIPNLQRAANRSKFLQLIFNGQNSSNSNISGGLESDDLPWEIKTNETDSFEVVYILSQDLTLSTYGKLIVFKWKFRNVISNGMVIDLNEMNISPTKLSR